MYVCYVLIKKRLAKKASIVHIKKRLGKYVLIKKRSVKDEL